MAMETDPTLEARVADPDAERMGIAALFVDVIRRPRAAMRRLAARPGRRWIAPLLTLAVLSAAYAALAAPRAMEAARRSGQMPEMSEAQMSAMQSISLFTMIAGAVAAFVGTFIAALLVAAILHFVGTVFGGQQSFGETFTTTSWARVPLILRLGVQLIALAFGVYDPSPAGLSGMIPADAEGAVAYLKPLLGMVEIWYLWYLVLLGIALRSVAKISRGKALVGVLVIVVLVLALGMAGTALQGLLSGFTG